MNFHKLLTASTLLLTEAGCSSPSSDAEWLLVHAFDMTRTDLVFRRHSEISDSLEARAAVERFHEFVSRRAKREPLQHIIGTAPVMGLELHVGPGVFVPRPETELLAVWAIERAERMRRDRGVEKLRIVDLCTGSGTLALAIADALPHVAVIGVELDPVALEWARKNTQEQRKRGGTGQNVILIGGDVTDQALLDSDRLRDWCGTVDLVVSNPPYVPEGTDVEPEVHVDPHHAVFGGDDGLDVIRPMMEVVDKLLRPGGEVGIEHDDDSGTDMTALLTGQWEYGQVTVHKDFADRDRFTTAAKPAGTT